MNRIRASKGYLTIETTISLTAFWFMMMFLMNMGQVYRAQNYVSHGLMQAGKMLAFSSYDYEHFSTTESLIDWGAQLFNLHVGNDPALYSAWRNSRYTDALKRAFSYCAGAGPEKTNEALKEYGLVKGIDSISFQADVNSGNLDISVRYRVDLPFAFFGFDHIELRQELKCGLWK